MNAATAQLPVKMVEQLAKRDRRRAFEAHRVVDAAPVSAQAKELGHLFVTLFAQRDWSESWASLEWLAEMLLEHFNRRGCEGRLGRSGPGNGRRRAMLCDQSVANRVRELERVGGMVEVKRRKVPGATLKHTLQIRPVGLLRDALRGAYKGWRHVFDQSATPAPASTPKIRAAIQPLAAALVSALRAAQPKKLGLREQLLPEASMCRASLDDVPSDDRAAEKPPPRESAIARAALEAGANGDGDAADSLARLRAAGILD